MEARQDKVVMMANEEEEENKFLDALFEYWMQGLVPGDLIEIDHYDESVDILYPWC